MFVKELQAVAIDFDGAPGMAFYQAGEVGVEVIVSEGVRAAIKMLGEAAYGAQVGVDGGRAFAPAVKCVNMLFIQGLIFLLMGRVHPVFPQWVYP